MVAEMEKERALGVIAQRKANGQNISEQEDYLKFVCDILGESIPKYHTGKIPDWLKLNEELAIIKNDEWILTKPQTQELLSRISNMDVLNSTLMSKLNNFSYTPPVFNVPTSSSVGDVNVTINVPQGVKVDKHLMNGFGNQILSGIRAELKINK